MKKMGQRKYEKEYKEGATNPQHLLQCSTVLGVRL